MPIPSIGKPAPAFKVRAAPLRTPPARPPRPACLHLLTQHSSSVICARVVATRVGRVCVPGSQGTRQAASRWKPWKPHAPCPSPPPPAGTGGGERRGVCVLGEGGDGVCLQCPGNVRGECALSSQLARLHECPPTPPHPSACPHALLMRCAPTPCAHARR